MLQARESELEQLHVRRAKLNQEIAATTDPLRRAELAVLRAFGFRRSSLAWIVLAENAFLLVVGMLVGSLSALVAVAPRLATIHVPWASLGVTLAFVLVVGMLSSVAAVLGSLRVPLLPALKSER